MVNTESIVLNNRAYKHVRLTRLLGRLGQHKHAVKQVVVEVNQRFAASNAQRNVSSKALTMPCCKLHYK